MKGALLRYRIIAYVTGVWLLLLFCVAMPVKYIGGDPTLVEIVAPIHGVLYILYVLLTFDLSRRRDWSLGWTVVVMLGGAVPFLSFFAERRIVSGIREQERTEAAEV